MRAHSSMHMGTSRERSAGFTLIELMVALLLGLLVLGAAIGIFISNRQTYAATEGLGRVQENVRFAFELMARDIREAGGNPCGSHVPLVNVVTNSGGAWWSDLNSYEAASGELVNPWAYALRGFSGDADDGGPEAGDAAAQRASGTQAIRLLSADDAVYSVQSHNAAAHAFTLNEPATGLSAGSLVIACDSRQASVFQASSVAGSVVGHATGGGGNNCTGNLGLPPPVGSNCAGVQPYAYLPNAMLSRLNASEWYVGPNGRGGTSLYQGVITNAGDGVTTQEVLEGVSVLDFAYLLEGGSSYVSAATVGSASSAAWGRVRAIRIDVQLESEAAGGTTDGNPLRRSLSHVVTLRNRTP